MQNESDIGPFRYAEGLFCAWPEGELTLEKVIKIIKTIARLEVQNRAPFNRFIDINGVQRIVVTEEAMAPVTERRKHEIVSRSGACVKIALLASSPITYSMARIYERLMAAPEVMVMVFRRREDAAHWLEVDPTVLERPRSG